MGLAARVDKEKGLGKGPGSAMKGKAKGKRSASGKGTEGSATGPGTALGKHKVPGSQQGLSLPSVDPHPQ